jgi:hypothetical protein
VNPELRRGLKDELGREFVSTQLQQEICKTINYNVLVDATVGHMDQFCGSHDRSSSAVEKGPTGHSNKLRVMTGYQRPARERVRSEEPYEADMLRRCHVMQTAPSDRFRQSHQGQSPKAEGARFS